MSSQTALGGPGTNQYGIKPRVLRPVPPPAPGTGAPGAAAAAATPFAPAQPAGRFNANGSVALDDPRLVPGGQVKAATDWMPVPSHGANFMHQIDNDGSVSTIVEFGADTYSYGDAPEVRMDFTMTITHPEDVDEDVYVVEVHGTGPGCSLTLDDLDHRLQPGENVEQALEGLVDDAKERIWDTPPDWHNPWE